VDNTGSSWGGFGVVIAGNNTATDTGVRNNILYHNSPGGIDDQGTHTGTDHKTANAPHPRFLDAPAHEFHPASSSPAIDAGVSISSVTTASYGASRPPYDEGAIEYVSTTSATQLVLTALPTVTAGSAFSFTVSAVDASNNVVTGYAGTVRFT